MNNVIFIAVVIILLVMSLYINENMKRLTKCEEKLFTTRANVPYSTNTEGAKMPNKAHPEDAGFDLYSDTDCVIPAHGRALVSTGVAMQIPYGGFGLVTGRSGMTIREGVIVAPGIIDSNYRGNIGMMAFNTTDSDFNVKQGDRLGQIILMSYLDCNLVYKRKLEDSNRGYNGFGSSGK